jgi:hypothetical protein
VDLLVSISSVGLERDLAFRTRLLDAAWGGVCSLSVAGGSLARQLEEAGAGRRVAATASALADAVTRVLGDPAERERWPRPPGVRGRARLVARRGAIAAWCREARVDPGRLPLRGGAAAALAPAPEKVAGGR